MNLLVCDTTMGICKPCTGINTSQFGCFIKIDVIAVVPFNAPYPVQASNFPFQRSIALTNCYAETTFRIETVHKRWLCSGHKESSSMTQTYEGGCLCGTLRYMLRGKPEWAAHCHCRSCQKATGGAFTTWMGYQKENFKITKGQLATCNTSADVERGFCDQCGTSLTYAAEERWPGQIHILAPTLDNPAIAKPQAHVYVEHQLPWIKLDDGLPRREQT